MQASAKAHSNIAFIKYWGNRDDALRIPSNGSLSMNLDGILTETTVRWDDTLSSDVVTINDESAASSAAVRVTEHLDLIRNLAGTQTFADVKSTNNFPMGAGIASSASAFAALTVAATQAVGLNLTERELSSLARRGSGSASRSIPSGFVEWYAGDGNESSYAESIAPASHWPLIDVIAIVSKAHKHVVSRQGHTTASTSDFQVARVAGAAQRIETCRQALLDKDFATFATVVEHDSNLMHAVMMTSRPSLFYWLPASLTIMQLVREWRQDGLNVCYTMDAGPNVHCLCLEEDAQTVADELNAVPGVAEVRMAWPGGGAEVL